MEAITLNNNAVIKLTITAKNIIEPYLKMLNDETGSNYNLNDITGITLDERILLHFPSGTISL